MDLRQISDLEEYRRYAEHPNINFMSGRGHEPELVQYIASAMFDILQPSAGETVVDVGCGDGSFLLRTRRAIGGAKLIGVLPSAEEVSRLREHLKGEDIKVILGTAEQTGLPPSFADVVVCNGVLIILPSVPAALREIARIARSGARVYLGEVDTQDERERVDYHKPTPRWRVIVSNVKRFGPIAGLKVIVHLLRAWLSGRWRETATRNYFHCSPDRFIAMCRDFGLEIERQFSYPRPPVVARERDRESYLFRRAHGDLTTAPSCPARGPGFSTEEPASFAPSVPAAMTLLLQRLLISLRNPPC